MDTDEEKSDLIQGSTRSDVEIPQAELQLHPHLTRTETSIGRELAKTTLSLGVSGILQSVEDSIRLSVISKLGVDALAADGLYRITFGFVVATDAGFLSPLDALVSTAYGKGEYAEVGKILRQAWIFGTVLSIPPAIVLLNAEPILNLFGQDPEITHLIGPYARAAAGACLPLFLVFVDTAFLKGTHSFKSLIALSATSTGIGIGLSYLLIAGYSNDSRKALLHSGYVTLIQAWVQFLGLKILLCSKDFKRYEIYSRSMNYKYLKDMLGIGSPMTLASLAEQLKYFVIGIMMGRLGKIQLAINQAAMVYVQFFVPPALAIRQASTLFVSKYKGRRDFVRMRRLGNIGIAFEASIYLIPLVGYAAIPKYLATRYVPEQDIQDLDTFVRLSFITAALTKILESLQGSLTANTKGLLDTCWPSVVWIINSLAIALPLSYLFAFTFKWDLVGLNAAASLSAAATLPPLFWRWRTQSHVVELEPEIPVLPATNTFAPAVSGYRALLEPVDRTASILTSDLPSVMEHDASMLPERSPIAGVIQDHNAPHELESERDSVRVVISDATSDPGAPILRMYDAHVARTTPTDVQREEASGLGKTTIRHRNSR